MKKALLTLVILISSLFSMQAQTIHYEASLEEAKALALRSNKPVAVLITIQPPVPAPAMTKDWEDPAVIEKFNRLFINYKVARENFAVSQKIISDYRVVRFPSFVFLDAKGGLMFTDIAFSTRPQALLDIADRAMAATREKSLTYYDSAYHAGARSTAFLKEYILRRRNTGITDNADLIETYVSGLTVADLNDYAEVLFILKAGPLLDSTAYKLTRINKGIVDSIYKKEPLGDRVAMNNAIIGNTMRKAIEGRNETRAMAAANFTRSSWTNDYLQGRKNFYIKMLQYYNAVKDTSNYLQMAAFYYDKYYMESSLDSVKKEELLGYETAKQRAFEKAVTSETGTRTATIIYSKGSYATDLNNAAWNFYKYAGASNRYLTKAMLWSKRSIEYSPKPEYYDTYAHILYRLDMYDEAERMQKNAIDLAKTVKANSRLYEEELDKIKRRTL